MAGTRQNGKVVAWKHRPSDGPGEEAPGLLETWELVEGGFVAAIIHCPAKPEKSYDWRILPAETRALADALRGGTVRTLRQAKSEATRAMRDRKSLREQWGSVKRAVVSIARMHGIEADALPLIKFAHELGASSETILRVLSYYSSPDEVTVAAE
jgi:hypothetical protein